MSGCGVEVLPVQRRNRGVYFLSLWQGDVTTAAVTTSNSGRHQTAALTSLLTSRQSLNRGIVSMAMECRYGATPGNLKQ